MTNRRSWKRWEEAYSETSSAAFALKTTWTLSSLQWRWKKMHPLRNRNMEETHTHKMREREGGGGVQEDRRRASGIDRVSALTGKPGAPDSPGSPGIRAYPEEIRRTVCFAMQANTKIHESKSFILLSLSNLNTLMVILRTPLLIFLVLFRLEKVWVLVSGLNVWWCFSKVIHQDREIPKKHNSLRSNVRSVRSFRLHPLLLELLAIPAKKEKKSKDPSWSQGTLVPRAKSACCMTDWVDNSALCGGLKKPSCHHNCCYEAPHSDCLCSTSFCEK